MYLFSQKSVFLVAAFVVLATVLSVSSAPKFFGGFSTFKDVDTSKKINPKAAADQVCGSDLSVQELTRRQGLGNTAEEQFFNPRILDAMSKNNKAQTKALNCQKQRIKVMKDTCLMQANIKEGKNCEGDVQQVNVDLEFASKYCTGVDPSLFVVVTGISNPISFGKKTKCGGKDIIEEFSTKFSSIDISVEPGTLRENAEKICSPDLSAVELKNRSRLAETVAEKFFDPKIAAAVGNKPLLQALNCQKFRVMVMHATCLVVRAQNRNSDSFQVNENLIKQQQQTTLANTACATADPNLFVPVTGF